MQFTRYMYNNSDKKNHQRTGTQSNENNRRFCQLFVIFVIWNKQTNKLLTDVYWLTENQLQINPNFLFIWSTLSILGLSQV